jgi:Tfp pilus assembly protein PilO
VHVVQKKIIALVVADGNTAELVVHNDELEELTTQEHEVKRQLSIKEDVLVSSGIGKAKLKEMVESKLYSLIIQLCATQKQLQNML